MAFFVELVYACTVLSADGNGVDWLCIEFRSFHNSGVTDDVLLFAVLGLCMTPGFVYLHHIPTHFGLFAMYCFE